MTSTRKMENSWSTKKLRIPNWEAQLHENHDLKLKKWNFKHTELKYQEAFFSDLRRYQNQGNKLGEHGNNKTSKQLSNPDQIHPRILIFAKRLGQTTYRKKAPWGEWCAGWTHRLSQRTMWVPSSRSTTDVTTSPTILVLDLSACRGRILSPLSYAWSSMFLARV